MSLYIPKSPESFWLKADTQITSANERLVLHLIRKRGRSTRADLTRATGLTAQSVSRIVDDLVDRGFLALGERIRQARGQPSVAVRLVPEVLYTFGVSLMSDGFSIALVDFAGKLVDHYQERIFPMRGETVLQRVSDKVGEMTSQWVAKPSKIFGMGIGVSGFFTGIDGSVNPPDGLDDWADVDLRVVFAERLDLPVWIENDGNAAAIGEALLTREQSGINLAYFYFSSGFGGGVVVDGNPVSGAHGNAGEFNGITEFVGFQSPSLETLRQELLQQGIQFDCVYDMLERYDPNWKAIEPWLEKSAKTISLIASAVSIVIDPEVIVFGGRIPADLATRLIARTEIANTSRRSEPRPEPRLELAEIDDACAIGAAVLPLKDYFFIPGDHETLDV